MTHREIGIAKAILKVMHEADGVQRTQATIHAEASLAFGTLIPLNEFEEVFEQLNADGCFIGVPTRYKILLWSISAKGEQVRQELK